LQAETLTKEEKLRILKTLEVDIEFRYAIAGYLGIREILEELRRLREDFNTFVKEQEKRWEENNRRWEEAIKRLEEHSRRLEELTKRVEEHSRILEEHSQILEEHGRRLEELSGRVGGLEKRVENLEKKVEGLSERVEGLERRVDKLEVTVGELKAAVGRLEVAVGELRVAVGSMGRRMGRDLELLVLNLYRDSIERFGIDVKRIEKVSIRDREGKYLSRDSKIEVDIYMSDETVYMMEVKSLADEEDVEWFNTKCDIVAREKGITSYKKLLVTVNVTREALERAKNLGVEVIYGSIVD